MDIRVLDKEKTGNQINNLLKERNMTVRQLANGLGLESVQAIYKWLRSDTMPSIDNLVILSGLLGVSIDEIIQTQVIKVD